MNGKIAVGTLLMCFAIALTALASLGTIQLIPCPDCGRDVSRRALMCPNCGLKGEVSDGKFAVLPLDPVLGAAKLKVSKQGREVGWLVPELAVDAPIVRLRIAETNLVYWSIGGEFAFDGQVAKSRANEVGAVVSPSISTNAFDIAGREWQVLQPKDFMVQGCG